MLKPKLQKLFDFVVLGYASVFKGDTYDNKYMKFMLTGYFMTYFFFNRKRAMMESKRFSLRPKFETSRMVWNLWDTHVIKHALKGILAGICSIRYRKKMYLKRSSKEITSLYVDEIISRYNSKNFNKKVKEINNISKSVNKSIMDHYNIDIDNFETKISPGESFALKVDKENKKNYVKIKLLSSKDLFIPRLRKKWSLFSCCLVERNYTRNALIIHIHGGGFVAMSSSSHENYLRKWCNKLEVPVISIDYRLAPENPYPKALDDVWQAYNWIVENSSDEFQIDLNKIILIGDSAGGNLALSLVYLLIIHNKRLPDALFLAYPGKFILILFKSFACK
jgi:hormone-sensitive lipase